MNNDQATASSPASREKLDQLWASLLEVFQTVIQAGQKLSTEMMNCIRLFLKDNQVKPTAEQQEQLQQLHKLMTERLMAAMQSDGPASSTLMETTRRFLIDNNIVKGAASTVDVCKGLEQVADFSLPFKTTH